MELVCLIPMRAGRKTHLLVGRNSQLAFGSATAEIGAGRFVASGSLRHGDFKSNLHVGAGGATGLQGLQGGQAFVWVAGDEPEFVPIMETDRCNRRFLPSTENSI